MFQWPHDGEVAGANVPHSHRTQIHLRIFTSQASRLWMAAGPLTR